VSNLPLALHELHIEHPTSRRVIYDVEHAFLDDGPDFIHRKHVFLDDGLDLIHKNFRTPLADTYRRLAHMLDWSENWDGEGSAKPSLYSILEARRWIRRMRADATRTGECWIEPHTVADENGDVVFEWWNEDRNLIVYVSPHTIYYLQVWGEDVESQMADGQIETREDHKKLWLWLMG
jgi:hypothetical protein